MLGAGTQGLSVTFTPTDSVDYNTALDSTNLTVNQATAGVNVSCSPNPITYGSQTTNCTATVGGSATGSVRLTINGGAWTTTGLSGGSNIGWRLCGIVRWLLHDWRHVWQATAIIARRRVDYADNTEGQPHPQLDDASQYDLRRTPRPAQLDPATASVPGRLLIQPAAGNLLPGFGLTISHATFTPTDSTDYNQ